MADNVAVSTASAAVYSKPQAQQERTGSSLSPAPNAEQERKAEQQRVSTEQLDRALSEVQTFVRKDLNFRVDDASGRTVIKVIDSSSQETVRQIPSEDFMELARKLAEMNQQQGLNSEQAKGLIINTRV